MFQKCVCVVTAALLLSLTGTTFAQVGPTGWWAEHVGDGVDGSVTLKGTTVTIIGDGHDIWDAADGFQFMYKQLTGDGSMTARVTSVGTGSNAWAKGGIMIRQDDTPGSVYAIQVLTGSSGNGCCTQWRATANAAAAGDTEAPSAIAAPYWVKLDRKGNVFTGSYSADGEAWTLLGTVTLPMTDPVLIGLCVTSHAAGELRSMTFDNISWTGNVTDRPPQIKVWRPNPADGATAVTTPMLQWMPGETTVFVDIYVSTTPDFTAANRVKQLPVTSKSWYQSAPPLEPGVTYYWRVDALDAKKKLIAAGDVWSFTMAPVTAYAPMPANGTQYQDPNVDLTWTAGQDAMSNEVYFSTNKDDVVNGAESAFKGSQLENTYVLPLLPLDTTYYWRVDEIDSLDERQVGDVWSFTTTIAGLGKAKRELWLNGSTGTTVADLTNDSRYPGAPTDVNEMPDFESPASNPNIDNYGGKLSAWLHVPVAGQYTFWVASDDNSQLFLGADPDSAQMIASVADWTNAQEWDKFGTQKSNPITLEAGRYYLMALWKDGIGGDNCAAAWQGPGIPIRELIHGNYLMPFEALWAYGPRPRNNDPNAPQVGELKWTTGSRATAHQIYFSEDQDAVANGTQAAYRGQQSVDNTSFDPGALEFGKTYYWRVDEISTTDSASPWQGAVWKFTTANYIVVDTFEDYTDDVTGRIFQTWIDGWGYTEPAPGDPGNGTGATVGYIDPPFAERTVVHGGIQSMPLAYNNADSPNYSETSRTFDSPQNWTVNGMNTLSLQVHGYPQVTSTAVTETGGKMTLTGSGTDIWGTSDQFTYAYKTLNGDGTIVARVVSIGPGTQTWAKGGVMIRDSLDGNAASAQMCLTANTDGGAGNGAAFQNRATTGLDMNANDATSNTTSTPVIAAPYWVKIERVGNTLNGYVSSDGNTWAIFASTDVVMTSPVYIGICVTAHSTTGEQRTFQFDGIKTTGSVTGAWQGAVINSPQYNSAQNLYVAIQDSANKLAVVTDATVVNSATWVEVRMPLSSFTGVSMTKVKKLFIGVGDRNSPAADGSGMLFIDDIRVIKP